MKAIVRAALAGASRRSDRLGCIARDRRRRGSRVDRRFRERCNRDG